MFGREAEEVYSNAAVIQLDDCHSVELSAIYKMFTVTTIMEQSRRYRACLYCTCMEMYLLWYWRNTHVAQEEGRDKRESNRIVFFTCRALDI